MLYYRNSRKLKNMKTYKISYSSFASGMDSKTDDNLVPHKYAKLCYNYISENGALKTGHGFSNLSLPRFETTMFLARTINLPADVDFIKVWQYKYYSTINNRNENMLVIYCSDKKLYWCKIVGYDTSCYFVDENLTFTSTPIAINYKIDGENCMVFSSPTDDMVIFNPNVALQTISTAPKVVSMSMHYERLFAIVEGERNILRFSDDLDITNWAQSATEGGYIQLDDERGAMNKVVSFGDYLYIFRDYGITRILAYGDQNDFSVSHVYNTSGRIYGDSVQVCGDKIMFFSKTGLYSFNGESVQQCDIPFSNLYDGVLNTAVNSAYLLGKYYLACKFAYNDGQIGCETSAHTNNTLLEFDVDSGEYNITRGVDVLSMMTIEEKGIEMLVACFGGTNSHKLGKLTSDGTYFGLCLKKVWKSPKSTLGFPTNKKIIKSISIETEHNSNIQITCDSEVKTFAIPGKNSVQTITPKMVGNKIEVAFISTGALANISCPEIEIGVIS